MVIMDPYGRKIYLAHLELMDQAIGNMMKALKKHNLDKNTFIFFTTDNGGSNQSYANNGDLNQYKFCLMDGGIKTPMIVSWPAAFKPTKIDATVTHRDLFASLSSITGVAPKNALDGKSLIPLIHGNVKELHTEPLFWDSGPREKNWVVRQGDWKLVYREKNRPYRTYALDENGVVTKLVPKKLTLGMQLYNLADDPGERKNLADQYPEKVAAMEKSYTNWRSKMLDPVQGHKAK